jgi:hypothetical protein
MPLKFNSTMAMSRWLRKATTKERAALAKAAKTSSGHLKHVATGRRGVSADVAIDLAAASHTLKSHKLYLDQRELCHACSRCPLVSHPAKPKKAKPPAKAKAKKSAPKKDA